MRLLGRATRRPATPYAVQPPYEAARADLLSRRPALGDDATAGRFGRLFLVVVDLGFDNYLASVCLFADGTISIYSTGGIHSTGLHGAPSVAQAAEVILEEVSESLGVFSPVEDIGTLPLPPPGHTRVLVRTRDGDLAASDQPGPAHVAVARLSAMAVLLTKLARVALVEGFDRAEPGEVIYRLAPEYRRMRSALLDWLPEPEQLPADARVAGVTVEIGEAETETVTSLFAFVDGSTSVYRSDGSLGKGLSGIPGIVDASRALLDAIEPALPAFVQAGLISPPQPGRVQFVTRARFGGEGEWTELVAIATRTALAEGRHPLSAAFARANEVLKLAD
jgi:hypothetical protein